MDSSKKALFRAKLKNKKKEKRLDSPLVRYNESDEPVCRVCDVVFKSDSLWDAHRLSRKHREAISNLKAAAATGLRTANNAKPDPLKVEDLSESKPQHVPGSERSTESTRPRLSSSGLPPDFFDNSDSQNPNSERNTLPVMEPEKYKMPTGSSAQTGTSKPALKNTGSESKGALPEGFFDNKEADLLARGIKPVKPDVKDEYKQFEKLIQEDLQEVDNRLEEEEFDAAEMIEEAESVEQKTYREKVELLRKRKIAWKAAKSAKQSKGSKEVVKERPSHLEESSSDDNSDENFAVDWRAQHL